MPRKTDQLNFRITDEGKRILYALQDHFGLTQSGVMEMILRRVAREEGIDVKNPQRKLGSTLGSGKGGRHA